MRIKNATGFGWSKILHDALFGRNTMLVNCPRSYRFFSTMPQCELLVVHQYVLAGWTLAPTGSRFICPRQFLRDDSDWDVMVLNEPGFQGRHMKSGYDHEGLHVSRGNSGSDSFRAGMLNMILLDAMQWKAWQEANQFAIESPDCWRSRDERVKLFRKMEEVVIHRGLDKHKMLASMLKNR